MKKGGNSQDRRRTRRAAARRAVTGEPGAFNLSAADTDEIRALVALAVGGETDELAEIARLANEALGGKPNQGTKPDKRLKENGADDDEEKPEKTALAALNVLQDALTADLGVDEPSKEIATAYVKIRPDLSGFEAEVEAVVKRALAKLTAAAGDPAWGPEEGFMDLLNDANQTLRTSGNDSFYPWVTDVSVKLDKVLICDQDGYYVAALTIDGDGEPTVAARSDWIKVEESWVESDDEMAVRFRNALRESLTADGALAPPLPAEHQPGERIPEHSGEIEPPEAPAAAATGGPIKWVAAFVPEGKLTEDGRAFAPESVSWRDLPLTLMAMTKTSAEGGHDGAEVSGRIDNIWRDGSMIRAAGEFSAEEYGQMIARMVESGELRGLSIDIAPLEWERSSRGDWFDEDGNWIATKNENGEWAPAAEERSVEEALDAFFGEDAITVITKGVIGMATVCPFPAFADANISLTASGVCSYTGKGGFILEGFEIVKDDEPLTASAVATADEAAAVEARESSSGDESLTAAAAGHAPSVPPAEWFTDPELSELTPLTITDEGRIFGHAWDWETCHTAFADECILAPHSATDYAYFHLGEVELSNGTREPVGKITLDTGHAGQRFSRAEAVRHYDDTGTVVAHIVVGEDAHGGWFAGAITPDLPEATLRLLRGSTLSGDWRGVNGNLELIALLAVNVPGFPIPRPRAFVASGEDGPEALSMTAAGIICEECGAKDAAEESVLTADEVDAIRALTEAAAA